MKISPAFAVAQAVVATLVGLVALPAVVEGAGGGRLGVGMWLGGAVLVGVWLGVLGPALAAGVVGAVGGEGDGRVRAAAGWLVVAGEVGVISGVLRGPLVGLVGAGSAGEAVYAALSVGLVLGVLVVLHRRARPVVEEAALGALDALVATSGSERTREAASGGEATLVAPGATLGVPEGATVRAPLGEAGTVVAPVESGATVQADDGATLREPRGSEATLLEARGGEATEREG